VDLETASAGGRGASGAGTGDFEIRGDCTGLAEMPLGIARERIYSQGLSLGRAVSGDSAAAAAIATTRIANYELVRI